MYSYGCIRNIFESLEIYRDLLSMLVSVILVSGIYAYSCRESSFAYGAILPCTFSNRK